MKLGIMQPYFMPYLGYISLIKHTDMFILFDTVQFIRHGWIERNRILKPNDGWQYIQVPLVKFSQSTKIKDVKINNEIDWRNRILAQLQHYRKKAPYYNEVIDLLNDIFQNQYDDIVSLNYVSLKKVCEYLNISTPIHIFSDMNLEIEPALAPDEWALNICKAIPDATEYWNPPGGMDFFDRSKYDVANIKLFFQQMNLEPYNQRREVCELGLSIIDVMMFNSKEEINVMLDNFILV